MPCSLAEIMQKKSSLFIWMSSFALVGLVVVAVGLAHLYHTNRSIYHQRRCEITAHALADSLRSAIEARVTVLTVLGRTGISSGSKNDFEQFAEKIITDYPDLYAVNLVSRDGVIQITHPKDKNIEAFQKNIFDHPEAEPYLRNSEATRTPQMSHRLLTFQGIHAFTLYIPLFNQSDELWGWLNAVVDFDSWIKRYLLHEDFKDTRVQVRWPSSETPGMDYGPNQVRLNHQYDFKILNQNLEVKIGFKPSSLEIRNQQLYTLFIIFGGFLIALVGLLVAKLSSSKQRLLGLNSRLALSNALLSSLTHDISNPLQTLNMILESFVEQSKEISVPTKEKIHRSLIALKNMLNDARKLHAQGLGLEEVKTKPLILEHALIDALQIVEISAAKKHIEIVNHAKDSKSLIMADTSTLVNNVLPNVFSNAIKFSPIGGKIHVRIEKHEGTYRLSCEDNGTGLSESQIRNFQRFSGLTTQNGTAGEPGTGLGLLQIKILMDTYGGEVELQNTEDGTRITLEFKKA